MIRAKVVCDSGGNPTPHDGRYVMEWNPHVDAGTLALDSTDDPAKAKTWTDLPELLRERRTISSIEPTRPWDGGLNKPLLAVMLEVEQVPH